LQSRHYKEPKESRRTTTNNNLLLKIKPQHGREIIAHKTQIKIQENNNTKEIKKKKKKAIKKPTE
jgi:cobyric acid synthase